MPVTAIAILGPARSDLDLGPTAFKLLTTLSKAYPLRSVYTIREDALGREIRIRAKALGFRRLGTSIESQVSEDREAMAVARFIWKVQRVIVYWDGSPKGAPAEAIRMCMRMRKPCKVFEL